MAEETKHRPDCRIFHVTNAEDFGALSVTDPRVPDDYDSAPAFQRAVDYAASLKCTCGAEKSDG